MILVPTFVARERVIALNLLNPRPIDLALENLDWVSAGCVFEDRPTGRDENVLDIHAQRGFLLSRSLISYGLTTH